MGFRTATAQCAALIAPDETTPLNDRPRLPLT